ncbi:leucine-rich repeat domain-containing protein [Haliscomenobacter sp.]|uniref:leucine-rich repeat domain-containing protein n=1 Tax=Haliscomenobacter sp. TaxID=2717303 RepID=UPI0035930B3C
MNFKPILWTYEPRKDGSCAVKIYGKKKYFQTGVAVDPQQWDEKNGKVLRAHPLHAQMNALIHAKILELEKNLLEGNELPTKTNLKAQAAQAKKSNIVEFIQAHIDEVAKGVHEVSPGTLAHYESLILRLTQFAQHRGVPHWTWSDINLSWYGDFWQFLNQSFGIQKTGGFANHIKFLKKFMTLAKREKLHQNEVHYEPEFKVHKSKEQKIYLTEQEVETIENLDLSSMPWLEVERDRWMVCYYFLLRYQDGQDHRPLADLFQLQKLDIFSKEIVDLSPLKGLINLNELSIYSFKINDLSHLSGLINLQSLSLFKVEVMDLRPLKNMINLEYLNIQETKVHDLSPLKSLTKLQTLSADNTLIQDLTPLANLFNLRELNLYKSQVNDLTPLSRLYKLEILNVNDHTTGHFYKKASFAVLTS